MKNIGILAFNIGGGGGVTSIINLIEIFDVIFDDLYLITTIESAEDNPINNSGKTIFSPLVHGGSSNKYMKIWNTLITEIKMSYQLLKTSKKVDIYLFIGEILVLPILTARILRKKVLLSLPSSQVHMNKYVENNLNKELKILTRVSCYLSTNILIYSPNLINEWEMEDYNNKIMIIDEHFLDFNKFKVTSKLSERNDIIGYVGRLSHEKGITNLIKALNIISSKNDTYKFVIIGNGDLKDELKLYTIKNELTNVEFIEWIDHDELPAYFNKFKLLVIPSYTEGLPFVMIEAMACGTPVIASSVGSIPDYIQDGKTGFILEDNSPECIAKNFKWAINHPEINEISDNAASMVKKEFSLDKKVKKWSQWSVTEVS